MKKYQIKTPEGVIETRQVHDYFELNVGDNLDVLFHDELGYGNCYVYSNENEGEGKYKVELFSARISDINASFEKINEELGAGRNNQWNDTSDPEDACQLMLEYYRIFDQENLMDAPLYVVPDYATGFRILDELQKNYIFVIINNPALDKCDSEDEEFDESQISEVEHTHTIDEYSVCYKGEYYKYQKIFEVGSGHTDISVTKDGYVVDDDEIFTGISEAVENR